MWLAIGFVGGLAVGVYMGPAARSMVKGGFEWVQSWWKK